MYKGRLTGYPHLKFFSLIGDIKLILESKRFQIIGRLYSSFFILFSAFLVVIFIEIFDMVALIYFKNINSIVRIIVSGVLATITGFFIGTTLMGIFKVPLKINQPYEIIKDINLLKNQDNFAIEFHIFLYGKDIRFKIILYPQISLTHEEISEQVFEKIEKKLS